MVCQFTRELPQPAEVRQTGEPESSPISAAELSYTTGPTTGVSMSLSNYSPTCARFHQFQVDLSSGVLQRSGVRVPVQAQPLQVLRLLLQADGKVVTREELRKVLWPEDTFVDFELGVNTAVKKLRQALADPADRPKFIETLPRIGYRFLVPVEWVMGDGQKGVPERAGNSSTSSEIGVSAPERQGHAAPAVERERRHRAIKWIWLA